MLTAAEYNPNAEVKQPACDKIRSTFFCDAEWRSHLHAISLLSILQSCNFQMFFWAYNSQCYVT